MGTIFLYQQICMDKFIRSLFIRMVPFTICIFYWVIDVKGYKKWDFFLVVIGMNAMMIWVGQELINFRFTADEFFLGFSRFLGIVKPVFLAFGVVLVKWLFLWFLYRQKIFFKT